MQQKRLGPANPIAFYITLALFVFFAGYTVLQKYIGHIDVGPKELVCIDSEIQDEGGHFYFKSQDVKKIENTGTITYQLSETTKNGKWKIDISISAMYVLSEFANMCDNEVDIEYVENIIVRDIVNNIIKNRKLRREGSLEIEHYTLTNYTARPITILDGSKAKATITRVKKGKK